MPEGLHGADFSCLTNCCFAANKARRVASTSDCALARSWAWASFSRIRRD